MKEDLKQKWKKALKKGVSSFLLYAFLPLICGGMAGGMLWLNAFGAEEAAALLEEYGEMSVAVALGGEPEEKAGIGAVSPLPEEMVSLGDAAEKLEAAGVLAEEAKKEPSVRYDALPENARAVIKCDLSSKSFFINTTNYSIDIPAARAADFPAGTADTGEAPLVLVLHTHATEGYLNDDTNLSDFAGEGVETFILEGQTSFRTNDPSRSVVQVGEVFSQALRDAGIPTLHCTVMHDQADFNQAYVNSAETVKALLAQYPSIQYVIDLHRDSVVRGDSYVKTWTETLGEPSAQVMLVVGTNQQGRHPNWLQNLTVATAFKDQMDAQFPGLSRSLYLRTARFNQEYLPGCMLLEVGSAMNTLEEAERAARAAGQALAATILSHR